MARMTCYYNSDDLCLDFNLTKNKSFVYDKHNEDYLNWIPVEVRLRVGENIFDPGSIPTLSMEGIKYFLKIIDKLLMEKNTLKIKFGENREYSTFSYYATEGEFEILLKNLYDDEREVDVINVTIWFSRGGYGEAYRFMTTLNECVDFFDDLKMQLSNLLSGLQ